MDLHVKQNFCLQSRTLGTGYCVQETVKYDRKYLYHRSTYNGVTFRGHNHEESPDTKRLCVFLISQIVLIHECDGKQTRLWRVYNMGRLA